jgi:hypothetical protein
VTLETIFHILKPNKKMESQLIPDEIIMNQIYFIPSHKLMLVFVLEKLYEL